MLAVNVFLAGSADPSKGGCGLVLRSLRVVCRAAVPLAELEPRGGAEVVSVSGATDHLELNGSVGESLASQSALAVLKRRGV